ncbi:hypothetical protein MVEG_09577 [Podila verticillata NRRL 6337]|nr:hypothetical protein MVEG_09577 [Podila verticillata NRRL 6337]
MSAPNERARRSQAPPPSSRHPSMPPGADSQEGSSVPSRLDSTISRTTLPRNTDINPFEVPTSQREQPDTRAPTFQLHSVETLRQPYHDSRLWASPSGSDAVITPSRPMGYDPSGRISRLGTFSTDEGVDSELSDHGDQSFDGQYNELGEGSTPVQVRTEELLEGARRRESSYPHTPNFAYPVTQDRLMAMWRSGVELPSSSSTPTPVVPPYLTAARAMPTSGYSQDSSFEDSLDSLSSSSYPYNDLGRRVADLQRRTMVSLSDIMGESRDEVMEGGLLASTTGPRTGPGGPGPGPSGGIQRTTGASTTSRSVPNPFLAQGDLRAPPGRTRQAEEERRDLYRDEDIGMELDQLGGAPGSFLRRRKSVDGDLAEDYGGSVLHREARLDPSAAFIKTLTEEHGVGVAGSISRVALPSTSDLIDELRRETSVQLTTPDELERRSWMYEDGDRIGKVQRLGLWQH